MGGNRTTHVCSAALVFVTAAATSARAGTDECNKAIDTYNQKADDISDTLRQYAQCLSDSKGADDCSSEFHQLKSDQDDFERAVSNYRSDCK
jgi:archaellum component FlaC